ncbi:uncharacterized protein BJ212DRAFT_1475449 [Suillus subaureus]|uniref:Uncharacterized protein n=1 Tax=Suillus subaureus TaxID=48587 RepID=A0A9P7EMJ1_9AGAM|nr:uncharacterized protein BJ212DRAFT_1475449 [Suillus subaureus]KAG1826109.1 hypothetical protein BJ212DRAFT_1475449 [Suillus subaureus]
MEQFIEAIHLVQNGHVSHDPEDSSAFTEDNSSDTSIDDIWIGLEVRSEDEACIVCARQVSHDPEKNSTLTEDNSSDTSIDDIWIGPEVAIADNGLECSSSNDGGDEAASNTSAETLINLDPAHYFNWFGTTSVVGVGLFSDITTAWMLCAPGTSVHYFTTSHEAKKYFNLALSMWGISNEHSTHLIT